jgi:hypothetical protein
LNELRYNKAVTDVENEQFLLNLVRLRYRDTPKSLAIGNITSSFSFDTTAPFPFLVGNTEAGVNAALTHLYNILAFQSRYSDVPTVSMTPLTGADYTTGLVAPIHLERITVLANTGWDLTRLLRLLVHHLNGLENAPHLAGEGGDRAPRFREFVAVAHTLGRLQHEGLLDLSISATQVPGVDLSLPLVLDAKQKAAKDKEDGGEEAPKTTDAAKKLQEAVRKMQEAEEAKKKDPDKAEAAQKEADQAMQKAIQAMQGDGKARTSGVTAAELITAANNHYMFQQCGDCVILKSAVPTHEMSIAPPAWHDSELRDAAHLLNVIPDSPCYRLVPIDGCMSKMMLAHPGTDIQVGTRSILSAMLFLSKGIDVPEKHYQQGLVTMPLDEGGNPVDWAQVTEGIFHVYVQKQKPKHAAVAIKYRGYWFYVADDDLSSKSTFDLLLEMHNVEINRGLTTPPVLTIPVSAGSGGGSTGAGRARGG